MKKIAILISGRGSNMIAIAKNAKNGILKDVCEISCVLSNKKGAKGLELASKMGIKTELVNSKKRSREEFEKKNDRSSC
ncbi:MAG: formyltransferase family protein [Pseudomonadota bacterium]